MPGSGERAYVYAKACGIIGKSFIGKRIPRLYGLSRTADLERLLFPRSPSELPERELTTDLERRIGERGASQILRLLAAFDPVPSLLACLVRSYEYADVKGLLSAVAAGDALPPPSTPLGSFATVRFDRYPDLQAMLGGTEFEWLLEALSGGKDDPVALQTELDKRYYRALWASLEATPAADKVLIHPVLAEEISLKNLAWALRLKLYYGKSDEDIGGRLVDVAYKGRSLAADALDCLRRNPDQRSDWRGFKYESLLNPEQGGEYWRVDPRHVQNAAALRLYSLARKNFRRNPFSLDAAAFFIKLKQFEEDLLTSVAEGLALGMPVRDVVGRLEVSR